MVNHYGWRTAGQVSQRPFEKIRGKLKGDGSNWWALHGVRTSTGFLDQSQFHQFHGFAVCFLQYFRYMLCYNFITRFETPHVSEKCFMYGIYLQFTI